MEHRIKELDGLRGIAVSLVLLLHFTKRAVYFTDNPILHSTIIYTKIGWIGVDIFFVLSGFLITSILLRSKNDENYFKNFYFRRALRIFPLYYVAIALVLLFAPKLEPEFIQNLQYTLPIMLIYQQNWLYFFNEMLLTNYLSITWSLAIEEQFYLIWPFIVKKLEIKKLLNFILIYIALSLIARISIQLLLSDSIPSISFYYSSFTRFEELLWGGLLAIWITYEGALEKLSRFSFPVFVASFGLFILLYVVLLPDTSHPGHTNVLLALSGYTLVAWSTVGLIGVFITQPSEIFLRRFFQNRLLVFLGKHSYSIYLFHMVVSLVLLDEFWHRGFRGWEFFVIYIISSAGVTILVAFLTWHLFEKYMLKLKKYFEYKNNQVI